MKASIIHYTAGYKNGIKETKTYLVLAFTETDRQEDDVLHPFVSEYIFMLADLFLQLWIIVGRDRKSVV